MERKEAVECITEIITESGWVPDIVSITNEGDPSSGYKITIASTDIELKRIVSQIAIKRNLEVCIEKDKVMIFQSEDKITKPC